MVIVAGPITVNPAQREPYLAGSVALEVASGRLDPRERTPFIMRRGQQDPLTTSYRLCDERFGGHAFGTPSIVPGRCKALAGARLHPCVSHSRRR